MNTTLVIQAGGQSSRMGKNKALMPFLGRPLIERVWERLAPVANECLVTVNDPSGLDFLGLPLIKDFIPGKGALGGLYTALRAATGPFVAVVACDMPFASPQLFLAQLKLLDEEELDVVIPQSEQGLEPLHAIYRRDTCLPAVLAAIESDQRRMVSWFPQVKVRILTPDLVKQFDPNVRAFLNVNTPEEFQRAEELARSE